MDILRKTAFVLCCLTIPLFAADQSIAIVKLADRFFADSLYNLALEQYQKFLNGTHGPEQEAAVRFKIGQSYFRMANMRLAAEEFESFIRLYPSSDQLIDALNSAAWARKNNGDYKDASDHFYAVWSRFVGNGLSQNALWEAAWCAEKDNNIERAGELYEEYLKSFSKQPRARDAALALGRIYIGGKEYRQAAIVLEKAAAICASDALCKARLAYLKARLAQAMQKNDEAFKSYAQAVADVAGLTEREQVIADYIDFAVAQKDFKTALDLYKNLAELYGRRNAQMPADILLAWAETARKGNAFEVAEKYYARCLEKPTAGIDAGMVVYRMAECQVKRNDFVKALETLQRLTALDTSSEWAVRAVVKTGDLYYSRQLYPSALNAYRRYLQLKDGTDKDVVQFRIAQVLQQKYQKFGLAIGEYDALVKQYPASTLVADARLGIAQCYEASANYAAALQYYDYLVESDEASEIAVKAGRAAAYIRNFKIQDAAGAVVELAAIVLNDEPIVRPVRLWRIGQIYENALFDFKSALNSYESIGHDLLSIDSLKVLALFAQGRVYEKMADKAAYENDSALALFSSNKALGIYDAITSLYSASVCAPDAAFRLMMLTTPSIADYEKYCTLYPHSSQVLEVLALIADYYEKRGRALDARAFSRAIEAYSHIVKRQPQGSETPRALCGMARCYLERSIPDSAEQAAQAIIGRFPQSRFEPEALYLLGTLARRRADLKTAAERFKDVVYRYPFSAFAARCRYEIALTQMQNGELGEAQANFRMYLQNYPAGENRSEAQLGLARTLLRAGRDSAATAILLELARQKLPPLLLSNVQLELARSSERAHNSYAALNYYKAALAGGTDHIEGLGLILSTMGALYMENRQFGDAALSYEQAFKYARSGSDSVAWIKGNIIALIMDGQSRIADAKIKGFADLYPLKSSEMAELIYHEGLRYLSEKKYDNAFNRFKYICAKFSKAAIVDKAYYHMALCDYYQNKKTSALALLLELPRKYPASTMIAQALFKTGMIYHERNEYAQSAVLCARVALDSTAELRLRLRGAYTAAIAYQKLSIWNDAAAMYTMLVGTDESDITPSVLACKIGFCLVQASRFEDALNYFQQAEGNPAPEDRAEIAYWIANCQAQLGNIPKAIAAYLQVPYVSGSTGGSGMWGITAEYEAARLYEKSGEAARARLLYQKIVRTDGEQGMVGRQAQQRLAALNTADNGGAR